MFFSFDGLDGSGKTTQMGHFVHWLRNCGRHVVVCRDPGSTPVGEAIRDLLLHREDLFIDRRAEMLLYMAARSQLVAQIIRPTLDIGQIVVSDRYLLANVVYQGHAGGLDPATIWETGRIATGGLMPRLTFVLDISPEDAALRLNRPLDRMEKQNVTFRAKLRQGFLDEAARSPETIVVIDALQDVETIQRQVQAIVRPLLGLAAPGAVR